MCGIAGWFGPSEGRDAKNLVQSLVHRGPDDSGIWQSESATLVHTRLAILDLTNAGHQPMVFEGTKSAEGTKSCRSNALPIADRQQKFVICYNGEIYNHEELRTELEGEGERFVG